MCGGREESWDHVWEKCREWKEGRGVGKKWWIGTWRGSGRDGRELERVKEGEVGDEKWGGGEWKKE